MNRRISLASPLPSALTSALAGRYEIEREIGRGGMATVYLARDLKHDRRVAVKVLDADLGAVLGVERFLGEIRVTATLQHPNLLPLFDSGEAGGLLYYVMPFVDGESLRARLDREKQLPVDDAIRIAVAIANAADYAHAHGVVHRDLKPENILLQSGQPIVADFGIALAVSNAGGARVTQTGISLGTPHYMSPEQATGDRVIDARSDVYALGAMTYEMLAGEPPHTGSTSQAIIARLLIDRPRSVRESRPSAPEHVDHAIARALEKLPADRFTTAKEFADALRGPGVSGPVASASPSATRRARGAMIAATVVGLVAVVTGVGWWRSAHAPPPLPIRFRVDPPPGVLIAGGPGLSVALSRDGQSVAFVGSDTRLFVRHVDQLEPIFFPKAHPAAAELHFSADGKWLAYWDRGPNRIAIGPGDEGAAPSRLVPLNKVGAIVSFSSDLIYLFENAFWSVPAGGGTPRRLALMDTVVDGAWSRPIMLPDGKTIAFSVTPRGARPYVGARLALISIDGGSRTLLDLEGIGVAGYADGILVFSRVEGKLLAVRFDAGRRKVLGQPVELVPDHSVISTAATVSGNGTLAYLVQDPRAGRVEIIDELGNVSSTLPETRIYFQSVASPDGKQIAVTIATAGQLDIWVYTIESRVLTQLTQTGAWGAVWSPDSKRIAFFGKGVPSWMAADGSTGIEPIPGTPALGSGLTNLQITPDGKYAILRRALRPGEPVGTPLGVAVPLAGGPAVPLLEGANASFNFAVSPNGKWIAYESRETGNREVFIRPFPLGAGKVQVSTDAGDAPQWSADGRRLFYRRDTEYRAVTLDVSGAMPRVVRSDVLFPNRDLVDRPIGSFSVHPDGKHFVVTHPLGDAMRLFVVTNWMTQFRAKLEGK